MKYINNNLYKKKKFEKKSKRLWNLDQLISKEIIIFIMKNFIHKTWLEKNSNIFQEEKYFVKKCVNLFNYFL